MSVVDWGHCWKKQSLECSINSLGTKLGILPGQIRGEGAAVWKWQARNTVAGCAGRATVAKRNSPRKQLLTFLDTLSF